MTFSQVLERLRAAAQGWQKGMPQGSCIVKQEDLRELLHHFDRLDQEVRAAKESALRIDHPTRTNEMCRALAAELEEVSALNAELLHELKECVGRLHWINDPRTGNTEKPWIKSAEKVIAKVEKQ